MRQNVNGPRGELQAIEVTLQITYTNGVTAGHIGLRCTLPKLHLATLKEVCR